MFALGLMSWLYGRPIEPTIEFLEEKFGAKRPEIAEANIKALQAGYAFGETTETFAVTYEVKPAKLKPGTYRNITGNQALSLGLVAASRAVGAAALPRRLPDHAGELDPRGARGLQALRRPHLPGGGRDRGRGRRRRRGVRRRARRHHLGRPRHRPQGGDDRPRDHARAAARDLRRPARRPVDRDADEAGAGRPADGALRPQRRVAGAGRRRALAVRLLRRRDRGGRIALKYRTPVYLLSDAYLANGSEPWLLPELDTLPDSRPDVRDRAERRRRVPARTCATSRRSRGRGRCRERRASSTGSAASRRPTAPATSPTTPTTTTR